jgi:hypothetical protein
MLNVIDDAPLEHQVDRRNDLGVMNGRRDKSGLYNIACVSPLFPGKKSLHVGLASPPFAG